MGLGIHLTGRVETAAESAQALAARIRAAAVAEFGGDEVASGIAAEPAVLLTLHPAAEEVELRALAGDRLLVTAKTSTVGPGYHAWLVERVDALGERLGVTWEPAGAAGEQAVGEAVGQEVARREWREADHAVGSGRDDTGYFDHRDFARLQEEMLAWLEVLASEVLMMAGSRDFSLGLPTDHLYESEAFAKTPLGPRDREWFLRVVEDPRAGLDLFAWWERGEGAGCHLGRALCLMWTEARWRPPVTEEEREVLERIAGSLETAFRLDPSRTYPWREWAEVVGLLDLAGPVSQWVLRQANQEPERPLAGYRRGRVRVVLGGGWSISIPGSFSEEWDDEGNWTAWEGDRRVLFAGFRLGDATEETDAEELISPDGPEGGERFDRREDALASRATLSRVEDDGEGYWQLVSETAAPPRLCVCTICFEDEADREWALETWRGIRGEGQGE